MDGNGHHTNHRSFDWLMSQIGEIGLKRLNYSSSEQTANREYFIRHSHNGLQRYAGEFVIIDGAKIIDGEIEGGSVIDRDKNYEKLLLRINPIGGSFIGYVPENPNPALYSHRKQQKH